MRPRIYAPAALALLICGVLACGSAPAATSSAATKTSSGAQARPAANDAGQRIAQTGAPNGVTACVSCHGATGQGMSGAGFPRLAGQSQYYLTRQLDSFANGTRNNGVMSPIAKAMSAQQRRESAAYYAALASPAAAAPTAAAKPAVISRGSVLAATGDESRQIQACANCHGPGGVAGNPAFPYLAGQHQDYLQAATVEWKNGARNTDPSKQMPTIASRLSDEDVAAVSAYYASQPPPPPAFTQSNRPAGDPARAVAPAPPGGSGGPGSGRNPAQGTGTEQGAPTTGGNQGPGGGGGGKAGPVGP